MGFWTGVQHATVKMKMLLRTTEVFRVEKGEWKMVHRHADMVERPNT